MSPRLLKDEEPDALVLLISAAAATSSASCSPRSRARDRYAPPRWVVRSLLK
jgi:hypothetical protein